MDFSNTLLDLAESDRPGEAPGPGRGIFPGLFRAVRTTECYSITTSSRTNPKDRENERNENEHRHEPPSIYAPEPTVPQPGFPVRQWVECGTKQAISIAGLRSRVLF